MEFKKNISLIAAGLINPCIYYLLLFQAYDRLLAQQALALNYTWPIVLVIFDSISRRRIPKSGLSLCLIFSFVRYHNKFRSLL